MLKGHGGNLRDVAVRFNISQDGIVDFSASVNPFVDTRAHARWLQQSLDDLRRYPDPEYRNLRNALAERYGVPSNNIVPGNGSSELLYLVPRALKAKKALIVSPSYADYADACRMAGATVERFLLEERNGFAIDHDALAQRARRCDLVVLGNPNNPTGNAAEKDQLLRTIKATPRTRWLIDEAFIDFTPRRSLIATRQPNLVILRSLTKFYGIPGLRAGFAVATGGLLKTISAHLEPWSLNCVAERFVMNLVADIEADGRIIDRTVRERVYLFDALKKIPALSPYPSDANFLLVRIDREGLTAKRLQALLLKKRVLIRDCTNFDGLDISYFRIAVLKRNVNRLLVAALKEILV